MKSKPGKFNLTDGGKDEFEIMNEFTSKGREITREVTEKYSQTLLHERSWIRRFIIKLKRELEIRKRIQQLSSRKNLHAVNA